MFLSRQSLCSNLGILFHPSARSRSAATHSWCVLSVCQCIEHAQRRAIPVPNAAPRLVAYYRHYRHDRVSPLRGDFCHSPEAVGVEALAVIVVDKMTFLRAVFERTGIVPNAKRVARVAVIVLCGEHIIAHLNVAHLVASSLARFSAASSCVFASSA